MTEGGAGGLVKTAHSGNEPSPSKEHRKDFTHLKKRSYRVEPFDGKLSTKKYNFQEAGGKNHPRKKQRFRRKTYPEQISVPPHDTLIKRPTVGEGKKSKVIQDPKKKGSKFQQYATPSEKKQWSANKWPKGLGRGDWNFKMRGQRKSIHRLRPARGTKYKSVFSGKTYIYSSLRGRKADRHAFPAHFNPGHRHRGGDQYAAAWTYPRRRENPLQRKRRHQGVDTLRETQKHTSRYIHSPPKHP